MKRLLIFLLLGLFVFTGCEDITPNKKTAAPPEPPREETFTITAVGDIMMHSTQIKAGYQAENKTYDFSSFFTEVKPYFEQADFVIGNLETTLSDNPKLYSGYPRFNAPAILAQNLKDAGFDCLVTANNHCLDKGVNITYQTLDYLDEANLLHTGTSRSPEEQEKICYTNIKGVKVAILAYTYGTNGLKPPSGHEHAVNLIEEIKITSTIKKARVEGAQLIILCLHFGEEYRDRPDNNQIYLAKTCFKAGADVILGSHAHVLQGSDIIINDEGKKQYVVYSLGNFISDQNGLERKTAVIANLHFGIDPETQEPYFKNSSYIPVWTRKWTANNKTNFKIIPIDEALAQIREAELGDYSRQEIIDLQQAEIHVSAYY